MGQRSVSWSKTLTKIINQVRAVMVRLQGYTNAKQAKLVFTVTFEIQDRLEPNLNSGLILDVSSMSLLIHYVAFIICLQSHTKEKHAKLKTTVTSKLLERLESNLDSGLILQASSMSSSSMQLL